MATSRGFVFNLLTPKSEEEIKKEEARDTGSLYSAVLPLIGSIIWVGLVLANSLILNNYVTTWQKKITNQEIEIISYSPQKRSNGELFLKARSLSGVIEKNINPEQFFGLVEGRLYSVSPNIEIRAYGREESGKFNVDAVTEDFFIISRVIYSFTSDPAFQNVELNSIGNDLKTGKINFKLSFKFAGNGE
ncbi:hypothetical protein JW796_04440 [Candidatus Dojkabacteria bacterium]|nr:hypothetical protein [Candidatus Dojkabacteria bacterium]